MFRGSDAVTIDEKGRFAIPARYRQGLRDACAGQMVVTAHHRDSCLLIYPQPRWVEFESSLLARGGLNPEVRRLQRHFVGNARDLDMDKQGRLLLPQMLKQRAGLNGKAVLVGMGQTFELWDEARWDAEQALIREQFSQDDSGEDGLPAGMEDLPL